MYDIFYKEHLYIPKKKNKPFQSLNKDIVIIQLLHSVRSWYKQEIMAIA